MLSSSKTTEHGNFRGSAGQSPQGRGAVGCQQQPMTVCCSLEPSPQIPWESSAKEQHTGGYRGGGSAFSGANPASECRVRVQNPARRLQAPSFTCLPTLFSLPPLLYIIPILLEYPLNPSFASLWPPSLEPCHFALRRRTAQRKRRRFPRADPGALSSPRGVLRIPFRRWTSWATDGKLPGGTHSRIRIADSRISTDDSRNTTTVAQIPR